MKNCILFIVVLYLFTVLTPNNLSAQTNNTQNVTFKVWGNCGMCEKTIEKSLKIRGVVSADWNKTTKMITVVYYPKKITLGQIHKRIASVGYDTEKETAKDATYNKLHSCCQYERKPK